MEENKNSEKNGEGEASVSSSSLVDPLKLSYQDLPENLQQCLMYCSIFPENHWIPKGKLIRLLVAQGLIQEKAGEVMEDEAEANIYELIGKGMLQVYPEKPCIGTRLQVPSPLRQFCVHQMEEGYFALFRAFVCSDITKLLSHLNNYQPASLFLIGKNLSQHDGNWLQFNGANSLRVLDLERSKIKRLPDGVGDLINLLYLGLNHTDINELPEELGRLKALQTLDIRWCGNLAALSDVILNLIRLRHLKMFKSVWTDDHGVKLPVGIGSLTSILTLTAVHAGGGIAEELGNLIQLRRLGVMDVAEENISALFASIMKMPGLLSLSLEAKQGFREGKLVRLDSFTPPPFLQKLRLEGILETLPTWVGSLERLTNLRLGFSHLSENPMFVLQLLPNLKSLTLWQAYDAKQIGKEFCSAGGFPKLEVLTIASGVLEEWTHLEEGALPSLKYLHVSNCLRLRMLPEGLQFLTTLQHLELLPLLDDHAERLKPDGGEENYKIRHIPRVSYMTTSMVQGFVKADGGDSQCR